jgi:hypothetical protein
MFTFLSGLHGRREHHALRGALAGCGTLALGTALACAGIGAGPAGAATRPAPVKPGSLYVVRHLPPKHGVSPDAVSGVQIVNANSGLCLDAETDSGGNPDESGDKVQLWTCNSGATQQRWNINFGLASIGTITSSYGNHLCLDAETDSGGNPTQNGDKVQMWTCNSGASQQMWTQFGSSSGALFVNIYSRTTYLAAEDDAGGDPSQTGDFIGVWSLGAAADNWTF